jgi:hypothetical protein
MLYKNFYILIERIYCSGMKFKSTVEYADISITLYSIYSKYVLMCHRTRLTYIYIYLCTSLWHFDFNGVHKINFGIFMLVWHWINYKKTYSCCNIVCWSIVFFFFNTILFGFFFPFSFDKSGHWASRDVQKSNHGVHEKVHPCKMCVATTPAPSYTTSHQHQILSLFFCDNN